MSSLSGRSFGEFYLAQKEMRVAKQNVFPPVGEIKQQTLQGVLGNKTKFIVHVHSKSKGQKQHVLNYKDLSQKRETNLFMMQSA